MKEVNIKIKRDEYTPDTVEYAAVMGSKGFVRSTHIETSGNSYFAFSNEQLDSEVIEKLEEWAEYGFTSGDYVMIDEVKYIIIQ